MVGILEPWKGYSVRNIENRNIIVKLSPAPANGVAKKIPENYLWVVGIVARAGDALDSGNYLGIRYDA